LPDKGVFKSIRQKTINYNSCAKIFPLKGTERLPKFLNGEALNEAFEKQTTPS
jgi:hypothetical protein